MLYFIVYGDVSKSLVTLIFTHANQEHFLTTRAFHVILIGMFMFHLYLKKRLQELKIASILLVIGIVFFIVVMCSQLLFDK